MLSFGCDDPCAVLGPDEPVTLGDVVIAPEVAEAQAAEYGHTVEEELNLLLVHGVLHLLGYDHEADEDAGAMQARERAILLGVVGGVVVASVTAPKSRSILWSFNYAIEGIVYALRTQRNMRIHVAAAILTLVGCAASGRGSLRAGRHRLRDQPRVRHRARQHRHRGGGRRRDRPLRSARQDRQGRERGCGARRRDERAWSSRTWSSSSRSSGGAERSRLGDASPRRPDRHRAGPRAARRCSSSRRSRARARSCRVAGRADTRRSPSALRRRSAS